MSCLAPQIMKQMKNLSSSFSSFPADGCRLTAFKFGRDCQGIGCDSQGISPEGKTRQILLRAEPWDKRFLKKALTS
jgi:hypothetical protein